MRWTSTYRHNPRSVIDKFNIYNQTIERLRVKMLGAGAPCTYYKNTSYDPFGVVNKEPTRCYCYNTETGQPDPRHFLCQGTGVLSGYQRYGFIEHVYASPSVSTGELVCDEGIITNTGSNTYSNSLILSNDSDRVDGSGRYYGEVLVERIELTRFKEFDRLLVKDFEELTQNRIEYYYSLDNVTWELIEFDEYTDNDKANKIANNIIIPEDATEIYLKFIFYKRKQTSTSSRFNSIRFRYRNMLNLGELVPRYNYVENPSFLACREQEKSVLQTTAGGLQTVYPLRWWTLPEVNISNYDVIEFHTGLYKSRKFLVSNIIRHTHGPELQLTHSAFETTIIRDEDDVRGILYLLD